MAKCNQLTPLPFKGLKLFTDRQTDGQTDRQTDRHEDRSNYKAMNYISNVLTQNYKSRQQKLSYTAKNTYKLYISTCTCNSSEELKCGNYADTE